MKLVKTVVRKLA